MRFFSILFLLLFPLCYVAAANDYARTTARLNMRTMPNTSAKVIVTVPADTQVEIIEKEGNWWKIKYRNNTGYASSKYLKMMEGTPSVVKEYGKLRFKDIVRHPVLNSKWWILLLIGGAVLMFIGIRSEPLVTLLGIWMEIAYIVFAQEPFYMICPSIVGWGWTILCFLPTILLVGALLFVNGYMTVMSCGEIGEGFRVVSFILILLSTVIFIFLLGRLIITEYIEALLFILLGAIGGGKSFVGTFIGSDGSVFDVYR